MTEPMIMFSIHFVSGDVFGKAMLSSADLDEHWEAKSTSTGRREVIRQPGHIGFHFTDQSAAQ
jgi:hypothetical protein